MPVLLFWGERDEVVPVTPSVERIRAALERAGNKDATIVIIPDADHNLITEPNPENMPSEEYLKKMIEWTLEKTRPKK